MRNDQELLAAYADHLLALKWPRRLGLLGPGLLGRGEGRPQGRVLRLLLLVVCDGEPGGVRVASLLRLLEMERRRNRDEVTGEWRRSRGLAVIAVKVSVGAVSQTLGHTHTPGMGCELEINDECGMETYFG